MRLKRLLARDCLARSRLCDEKSDRSYDRGKLIVQCATDPRLRVVALTSRATEARPGRSERESVPLMMQQYQRLF